MAIDNSSRLCAMSCRINLRLLIVALHNSGVHWRIPPAQIASLTLLSYEQSLSTEISNCEEKEKPSELLYSYTDKYTLMGLPVIVDYSLHSQVIELRIGSDIIYTIDALAVPIGFDSQTQGDLTHG